MRQAGLALVLAIPCAVLASPPDWAPAHGWRRKNDPSYPGYRGYSGRGWDSDYGVTNGSCDRSRVGQVIGGVVGGVAGGAVGSEVAKNSANREVAIVVGAVIGAAIGQEIGRRMDKTDRSCVGHSLELVDSGHAVKWTNPNTRVSYQLTPLNEDSGSRCRSFRLVAHGSFGLSEGRTIACADSNGVWSLAPDQRMTRN
jgi:surface antigen